MFRQKTQEAYYLVKELIAQKNEKKKVMNLVRF